MNNLSSCIPKEIQYNKNLSPTSIILLHELSTIVDRNGECLIDYCKLSENLNRTKKSILDYLKELQNNNYIIIKTLEKDYIVSLLKNKKMQGLGHGNLVCCWCGVNTTTMHSHHYPVSKKDGGKETIEICPNCHHEFHFDNNLNKVILNFGSKIISEIINIRENKK